MPYAKLITRLFAVARAHHKGAPAIPYKLTLEITRECNCPCQVHCNIWTEAKNPDELTTEEVVRSISSLGQNLFWLNITGGEPTLRDDLGTIVRKAVQACPNLFVVNIPLNGRNPEKTVASISQLVSENREVLFQVTLSIDGLGEMQSQLRGPDQASRTEKTWELLEELRKDQPNFRLSAQSTISSFNSHQALDLLHSFHPKSDNYVIAFATDADYYANSNLNVATYDLGMLEIARDLARKYPVRWRQPATFLIKLFLYGQVRRIRLANSDLSTVGRTRIECSASTSTVTLKADGTVVPCLFKDESQMGNVRENDFSIPRILRSRLAGQTRRSVKRCEKCWINCDAIPSMIQSPLKSLTLIREWF